MSLAAKGSGRVAIWLFCNNILKGARGFMKLGMTEILLILLAILLLFGANRLPELARAIGRSVTELKEGIKGKPEAP